LSLTLSIRKKERERERERKRDIEKGNKKKETKKENEKGPLHLRNFILVIEAETLLELISKCIFLSISLFW
jgi:hypothetical protein